MEKVIEYHKIKDIFISYKSEDYNKALEVKNWLEALAFKVWMAPEDIPGGSNYAEAIPKGIENCKVLVLILSQKAQESIWVRREVESAVEWEKLVIPFMIEKCELTPQFAFLLADTSIIHAYDNMKAALNRLQILIRTVPGITRLHPVAKKIQEGIMKRKAGLPDIGPDFFSLGITEEAEQIKYCIDLIHNTDMASREIPVSERVKAYKFIKWAAEKGDSEAMYELGRIMVEGNMPMNGGKFDSQGRELIYKAANKGYKPAEEYLSGLCRLRYTYDVFMKTPVPKSAPLRDGDGWKITINHKPHHPVSARLEYRPMTGNELIITVNAYIGMEKIHMDDKEQFEKAVIDGFKAWEGFYNVFGNQLLQVTVEVNIKDKPDYAVCIFPLQPFIVRPMRFITPVNEQSEERARAIIDGKKSIMQHRGTRWLKRIQKTIYINDLGETPYDNEQVTKAVRYEFGHVLGLGEFGVIPYGTYKDLDPYYVNNGVYNLVMCGREGMISDNDIEMVILALVTGEKQEYQGEKVSKALGRDN